MNTTMCHGKGDKPAAKYEPVCIIDNDTRKLGTEVMGVRVVATPSNIPEVAKKMDIEQIILAIPSKILGGVLGFIEYYIYAFIILLVLSIPVFNIDVYKSDVAKFILKETPLISKKIDVSLLEELKKEYDKGTSAREEEYIKILKDHGILKDMK